MKKVNIFLSVILVLIFLCGSFLPVFSENITFFQVFNVFLGVYDVRSYKGREGFATRTLERAVVISRKKRLQKKKVVLKKNLAKKEVSKKKAIVTPKEIELNIEPVTREVKKEVLKVLEEKKQDEKYEFILDDQLSSEIRKSPLSVILKNLTSKVNVHLRQHTLKKAFLMDKEKAKDLLIFLRVKDPFLLKNIANILAIINYNDAVKPLIRRIEFEENEMLLKILYKYLGMFTKFEVESYLNEKFQSNMSEGILEVLAGGLHGRADSNSINRARELLKTTNNLSLKTSLFHLLAYQGFESEGCDFARRNMKRVEIALRSKLLDVLLFSRDSSDLKFLDTNKRMFYKSKEIMDAYTNAKAFIATLDFQGAKRWDLIESQLLNNKILLADLALCVAKKWDKKSFRWLKEFAKNNYLLEEPLFIHALYLRDIPLKTAMTKEEESKRVATYKNISKSLWHVTMNSGFLTFDIKDLDVSIYLDGNIIDIHESLTVAGTLTGEHILKIVDNKSKEVVWKIFYIKNKERLNVVINQQEKKPVINSFNIKLLPVKMKHFIIGDENLQQTRYNVKFSHSLFISAYEITNIQYEQFDPAHKQERDNVSNDDMHPVIIVSWYDALKFCNRLSVMEGFKECYDKNNLYIENSNGYRLLTEAEWEYAAKSGVRYNRYPWGDIFYSEEVYFANFFPQDGDNLDGWKFTAPVGAFMGNEFGLFDMAGNVSEWCYDGYNENYYKELAKNKVNVDPRGSAQDSMKVCRGGSWFSRDALQSSYREFAHPTKKSNTRGIRICRRMSSFKVSISKL